MKTVMVTGAAGYIGSNLCKSLIQNGYNIVQIDKRFGSDILNTDLGKYNEVDCVVHLAAISSIGECQENIKEAVRDNILATSMVSEYAKGWRIPVIFASSQAIKNPLSSMYATTKFIGEQTLKTNNKYCILRFANVFGGDNFIDDKTSVVAKFIRAYHSDDFLIVNGSGNQTRDFIHVDDICKAITRCIKLEHEGKCMDVGTGIETSINDVASMFNTDIMRDDDSCMVGVESNVADIKDLQRWAGFTPDKSLKDYIRGVI